MSEIGALKHGDTMYWTDGTRWALVNHAFDRDLYWLTCGDRTRSGAKRVRKFTYGQCAALKKAMSDIAPLDDWSVTPDE